MKYIDHYEIEYRRQGGSWEHVGNVYPDYHWQIVRPWYLLGLVRRPKLVSPATAALRAHCRSLDVAFALTDKSGQDQFRIWQWDRCGGRLTRHFLDGHRS